MMKNSDEWLVRKRGYERNNNIVCKIFRRLYYELEGLIWLGICVGICVSVFKFVFFLGF